MVTQNVRGELPDTLTAIARARTESMQRQFGRGKTMLRTFAESCYLQGLRDVIEFIATTHPGEAKTIFEEMSDTAFSDHFADRGGR